MAHLLCSPARTAYLLVRHFNALFNASTPPSTMLRRRRAHSGNRKKPSSKPCQASSKSHSPLKGGSPVLIFTVCRAHPRVKRRRAAARRRLVVRFLQLRQTEPEREPGHVQRRRGASAGPDLGCTWQQRSSFATVHAAVVCSRPRRWPGCRKIKHTRECFYRAGLVDGGPDRAGQGIR